MNNRILGTIALICAPAMLIDGILYPNEPNHIATGIASVVFMAGWLASNVGMERLRATGSGRGGRALLWIQRIGLILALLFGVLEATQVVPDEHLLFVITDAAWPLSMLFMIVVGIATVRAGRLPGRQRWIPLLCPIWLPIGMTFMILGENDPTLRAIGLFAGFGWMTITWGLLALMVRSNGTLTSAPATANQPELIANAG